MPRLTIDDLKKIKDKAKQTMTLRSGDARARITIHTKNLSFQLALSIFPGEVNP